VSAVWLNGALLPACVARIDPTDRGFMLGDGVFETLRVAEGRLMHASRHLARMRDGAALLGIDIPYTDQILRDGLHAVARACGLEDAALRMTLSRGPAARGVWPVSAANPTLLITGGPLPPPAPPAHVIISQQIRRNELSPLSRIKSLNYLDSILARREAADAGADDALMLNTHGDLAEATAANICVVIAGRLLTPRVEDGALPGIHRTLLLEQGAVAEARITPKELAGAGSGFLCNSLGLRQIASIDGRPLNLWPAQEGAVSETSQAR
jgi:branched-chain amino acid aminotransferase